jgi:membrane carboxypeptidase/penicillin-binding protein
LADVQEIFDAKAKTAYFQKSESQLESESAAKCAALPRGGRVLIAFEKFENPTARRRWGFCF